MKVGCVVYHPSEESNATATGDLVEKFQKLLTGYGNIGRQIV